MNEKLQFRLLGNVEISSETMPVTGFNSSKSQALLCYLAVTSRAHARPTLVGLLWADLPETNAQRNLRKALSNLRKLVNPHLTIDRQAVAFNHSVPYWLDIEEFETIVDKAADASDIGLLQQAVELYRGDFLEGFYVRKAPEFERWVRSQRTRYRGLALQAYQTLATYFAREGEAGRALALDYTHRLLALDPGREEAHRQMMFLLTLNGQRGTALAQYDICRQILGDDLGVEPSIETTELYTRIRDDCQGWFIGLTPDGRQFPATQPLSQTRPTMRLEWGEAPDVTIFFGREWELTQLTRWIVTDRCRLVGIFGMGGIGKTALTTKFAVQNQEHFDYLIWRSVRNAPPVEDILSESIHFLSDQPCGDLPSRTGRQIALLIGLLRRHRCLLILDNIEAILLEGQVSGHYRPGYELYGQLIQRIGESHHQSCLLITSREKPQEFATLQSKSSPVRSLVVKDLDTNAGRALLQEKGLSGSITEWGMLTSRYAGNPLVLKVVAETIRDLYAGAIVHFLEEETAIFGSIRELLAQQIVRLSTLERELLYWLAIARRATTCDELVADLVQPTSKQVVLEALHSLHQRSLLEKNKTGLTLQNVVMEYVTDCLIEHVCQEVKSGEQRRLESKTPVVLPPSRHLDLSDLYINHFALIKAQAEEYIRESQVRLMLQPVADRLLSCLGQAALTNRLKEMLAELRHQHQPGYAGGNILNLLIHCGIDITGFDFSGLAVWQAYLRGVSLPAVNLAGADLTHSVFTDNFGAIDYVAVSPDGKFLAAGTYDGEIWLWQLDTMKLIAIMREHCDPIWCVAFSPDGRTLASCGAGATISLWDVQSCCVYKRLQGHTDWVWRVVFSTDGRMLASASSDHTVCLWDIDRGHQRHRLCGHTDAVLAVSLSLDGCTVASGGSDATVRLWDVDTGELLHTLRGHTNLVGDVAMSPNDRILASGGYDQSVRLWDVKTGEPIQTLQGHTSRVTSVAFSPSGAKLISCGGDQTVRLWSVHSGRSWRILRGHSGLITRAIFTPDGEAAFSGSYDQTVCLWDIQSGRLRRTLRGHTKWIVALDFSPDGKRLASGSYDRLVRLWDVSTGQLHCVLSGHTNWVMALAFSPDGNTLASGCSDRTTRLWDVHTGQLLRTLDGHSNWVTAVSFCPKGQLLATGSIDQTICLWDVHTGQLLRTLDGHVGAIWALAISPNGKHLASGGYEQEVYLWDLETGQPLQLLHGHTNWVDCLAFSPDGNTLASGGHDHSIHLWELNAPSGRIQTRCTLNGHSNRVATLAFTPNGETVFSGSDDRTIRGWNVRSGQNHQTFQGHSSGIESVTISPDGQILASSGADETIKLWDIQCSVCMNTLPIDGPYEGMDITDIIGLSDAQRAALKALGAVEKNQGVLCLN